MAINRAFLGALELLKKKGKDLRMPMISLLYIAALSPQDRFQVDIVEEEVEEILTE